ncbi:pyridoxine 5'-phosphate synthase [Pseudemcibacter aquimaris]|uniref:pyridoxine 5'-phosphate synthase n=1 Tax=Pseudemcibacter aquimaris TaxID=2857064 RepID=UPI002011D962|nr:pyridoxine 5'-phosphate synthase [Pseudemcibacter aquimaris]MCC3860659.1 pyridoxine 5'-phosphate synthase [Pseudemcibacter aquimaris]WDU59479.1 pyridoxine 5'-phosphate synthase [Pseudemcibacter aquimaris]
MPNERIRLGVNIDHVATVRNARGGFHPDPVRAALLAEKAGADGITAHLREDRRHIVDDDMERLMANIKVPLNFEMAATDEMLEIVTRLKPASSCLVPEKREELTTEGGLDVIGGYDHLKGYIQKLKDVGISVSLFIDADKDQIKASHELGADKVELHTGAYCDAEGEARAAELERLRAGAKYCGEIGLEVHAGHGLCYETVGAVAQIPEFTEFNIGHFMMGEAIFVGLEQTIKEMRDLMGQGRAKCK